MKFNFQALVTLLLVSFASLSLAYEATWESLDSRPLPNWYDSAKIGIFVHWGVFSVPAYRTEWFWERWQGNHANDFEQFVQQTEQPNFAYTDYVHRFTALFYNATDWATLFANSGAQYVVLTSKHHEGFCNWDSRNVPTTWNWNAVDVGPRRDLVGELSKAIKNTTSPHSKQPLKFGLYHSLYEWFNPMYLADKASNYTETNFVDKKTIPELYDLVDKYEPELLWSDGIGCNSERIPTSTYWKSKEFLAWYATNSTVAETAVWNDRWGCDTLCQHGANWTCRDKYQPQHLVSHKWESCISIDDSSWGYNRLSKLDRYYTPHAIIHTLIETVAYGGNLLLNIGPNADGTIAPIFQDRLVHLGSWLRVNGEAIYGTKPWKLCQNETTSNVYYTTKSDILYAHMLQWPRDNTLSLVTPIATNETQISMLGVTSTDGITSNNAKNNDDDTPLFLKWNFVSNEEHNESHQRAQRDQESISSSNLLVIQLPALNPALLPCNHAWVLKMTNIQNLHHPNTPKQDGMVEDVQAKKLY